MMSRTVRSAIVPFFDRLCELDDCLGDGVHLDPLGFQHSLLKDLARLFNTRCDLSVEDYLAASESVLHYGIPALTVFSPNSKTDLIKLEVLLAHAIRLFEPRLTQVIIRASNDDLDHNAVKVEILSAVVLRNQRLRFTPSFHLHPGQLEVVVQPETV